MNGIKKMKIWMRRHRSTIVIFAIIVAVLIGFFGRNFVKMYQVYRQKQELNAKIQEEKARTEQLDKDLSQLGDKDYIERIARDYFNMAYPEEKVVKTVEKEPEKKEEEQTKEEQQNAQ